MTAPVQPLAPGHADVLSVAAGWAGEVAIADAGGGDYTAYVPNVAGAQDTYVGQIDPGPPALFGLYDTPQTGYRVVMHGNDLKIEGP